MSKLLLLSILVAPLVIPARAARSPNARAGLKKTLMRTGIFNAAYLFSMIYIYFRL